MSVAPKALAEKSYSRLHSSPTEEEFLGVDALEYANVYHSKLELSNGETEAHGAEGHFTRSQKVTDRIFGP